MLYLGQGVKSVRPVFGTVILLDFVNLDEIDDVDDILDRNRLSIFRSSRLCALLERKKMLDLNTETMLPALELSALQ